MLEDEGFDFVLDGWGVGGMLVLFFQPVEEDAVVVEALLVVGVAEEELGCFGDEVEGEVKAAHFFLHHEHKYVVVDDSHLHRTDFLLKINHFLQSIEHPANIFLRLDHGQSFLAGCQLQVVPLLGVGLFCQLYIFLKLGWFIAFNANFQYFFHAFLFIVLFHF